MNSGELATARWFKSSRSNANASCVEVAFLSGGRVGLRDSKDKGAGPAHVFTRDEWLAFIEGAKDGEFDLAAPSRDPRRSPTRPSANGVPCVLAWRSCHS